MADPPHPEPGVKRYVEKVFSRNPLKSLGFGNIYHYFPVNHAPKGLTVRQERRSGGLEPNLGGFHPVGTILALPPGDRRGRLQSVAKPPRFVGNGRLNPHI